MRIVLDTNVLVSGMIHASGSPGRIVDLLRTGALQLVVDDRILAEYADVLRRPCFDHLFSAEARGAIIDLLRGESTCIAASVIAPGLPDLGDVPFLEVALSEGVPLVTGNRKHFPAKLCRGCTILSPGEFLDRLSGGAP